MSQTERMEARVIAELLCINCLIECLRIFRANPLLPKKAYPMTLHLILDIFKYRIERSFDKSPIRRKIERQLKKKDVDEIPNLIDLVDV